MHEAIFANVEVSSASPATPFVRDAIRDVFLEGIEARKRFFA
jgi:hypothetical protein